MVSKHSRACLGAGTSCLIALLVWAAASHAADNVTSVWQGIYTRPQAERGRAAYFAACASCHGAQLGGDTDAPDLAGSAFLKRWADRSVGTLFTFIESQMPVGRPRSLGAQGYADVTAHILATNGFPPGPEELPAGAAALDKIMIDKRK